MNIQYITDEKGEQQVVIPQKEWLSFQKEYDKIKMKLQILLGLENALKEVKLFRNGRKKGKTLNAFLDEL